MTLQTLFSAKKPLIGMIHLPALPGYPSHPGMEKVIEKALKDLATLEAAGFDGALVENDNDQPHQIGVNPMIKKAFKEVMEALIRQAKIPVGMEIIYDMKATLEVATEVGAQFVRFDVFVDNVQTQWGRIDAQAEELKKLKKDIFFMTDIQVKHATMLDKKSIVQSAKESIEQGSDALIITGTWTGKAPHLQDLIDVRKVSGNTPLFIGSGLDQDNANILLEKSDGAIVGTSIKIGEYVDLKKATLLKNMINQQQIFEKIISLLDENKTTYKLFTHKAALTYEDLAEVQKETGFIGTEGKCMVVKTNESFVVYITIQGKRLDLDTLKGIIGTSKIRLATPEELKEYFGAEPGCAYPFGFDAHYPIYIDPIIFEQEWFLFSPALSTKTVQAKGSDLKTVFDHLENKVSEIS